MEQTINRWRYGWYTYYEWRRQATFIERLLLSLTFSFFTGVSAQIFIRLPFTPVPVTGQVFMVLLSGALLGKNWAAVSQIMYLTGGIAGIPWFAAGHSGMVLLPSYGYIVGFIPASFFIGWIFDRGICNQSISRR
ncbi:MAG: biotin transporter BioY, partial [Candidatus Omnitrophica bacterium]|nr:biotin transporter BioY [Candidatus Omnitrophota bacterium]